VSKWKVRVLPTILDYHAKFGKLPEGLVKSLGSLIRFYRTDKVNDSPDVMEFFKGNPSADDVMKNADFWGMDLTTIDGFADMVKSNC
jgi:tagaturonate reductase